MEGGSTMGAGWTFPTESSRNANRSEVELVWRALMSGEVTREQVHEWVRDWEEGPSRVEDPMAGFALPYLHGFDLTRRSGGIDHGPPGEYVKSEGQIARDFAYWQDQCRQHDRDPAAWFQYRMELVEAEVREYRRQRREKGR